MAMAIQYDKIGGRRGDYHYAMTHNWDLVITKSGVPDELKGLTNGLVNASGAINHSCTAVSNLPNSNLTEGIVSGNIRGVPFHQAAGRESSVREINLTLYDYSDYSLFKFFECWKSMAVNRFDWSQNYEAMVKNGIYIIMSDGDRQTDKLTYHLFDIVCTKCNISDQLTADPALVQLSVSLKCGYYNIEASRQNSSPIYGHANGNEL